MNKKRMGVRLPEDHPLWKVSTRERNEIIKKALEMYYQGYNDSGGSVLKEVCQGLQEIAKALNRIEQCLEGKSSKAKETFQETSKEKPDIAEHLLKTIEETWG